MPAGDWVKYQVNINTGGQKPPGLLLNVYATDEIELSQLLDGLADVAAKVNETAATFGAVTAVSQQLGGVAVQQAPYGAPQNSYPQPAPQAVSGAPEPAEKEFCEHGPMAWKSGVSKAGNNYSLWECSTGLKPEQGGCAVKWPRRSR